MTRLLIPLIILSFSHSLFPAGNIFDYREKEIVFSELAFGNPFLTNTNENKGYEAFYSKKTFSLELQVNPTESGTVSGDGEYQEGIFVIVSAQPNEGYTFENWTWEGQILSSSQSFNFEMPPENVILVANFLLNTYTISAISNPLDGGTISGTGNYYHGENVTLVGDANFCFNFENWTENGQTISAEEDLSFIATGDRDFTANFMLIKYFITASSGEGGNINPSGSIEVGCDQEAIFSITPYDCYEISKLKINEQIVDPVTTYTFQNVLNDHTIHAIFQRSGFIITSSSVEGGLIEPSGEVYVECGQSKGFEITPSEGYAILDVKVDDFWVGSTDYYEFTNVRNDRSIEAFFIPFITGPIQVCPGQWSYYELNNTLSSEYTALKWSIQNEGGRIFGPDDSDHVMVQWGNVSGTQYLNLQVFIDPHQTPSNYVIEIEVSGTPPPEAVILRKGENILLVDEVSGPLYDEYQWGIMNATSFSDTFLGGENNQFCWFDNINTSSKYYWVETMQSGNGCKVRSFFNDPTGQQDDFLGNDLFDILLFPVPARQNIVYARWPVFPFNQLEISLITFDGKELRNFQFNFSEVNMPLKLDLAELPPGLYLLRFSFDKRQITKRLLIQ